MSSALASKTPLFLFAGLEVQITASKRRSYASVSPWVERRELIFTALLHRGAVLVTEESPWSDTLPLKPRG